MLLQRFFVVTECGDLAVVYRLLAEECEEDLTRTGRDCRCSQRCKHAMQALPLSCLTQIRQVMCMSVEDAHAEQLELGRTM